MTIIRVTRALPGIRNVFRVTRVPGHLNHIPIRAPACTRCFYRGSGGRDPFIQMEEFMRDMERKFKKDIDRSLNTILRDFPSLAPSSIVPKSEFVPKPRFGEIEDISTTDRYKLAFNFANANPEDVKVTLKGQTLAISGRIETVTETSKSSHEVAVEYQLPDDVDVDALESSLSQDGILTIEAPLPTPKEESPQTIHIQRE